MSNHTATPPSIEARQRAVQADAALDHMFGYYTRDDRSRTVVSELDARKAA